MAAGRLQESCHRRFIDQLFLLDSVHLLVLFSQQFFLRYRFDLPVRRTSLEPLGDKLSGLLTRSSALWVRYQCVLLVLRCPSRSTPDLGA